MSSSATGQESSTNKVDDRNQMTSKPRLSGSDVVKKYKMKLDEPKNSDFLNLFGTPITKTSKSVETTKPKEPPKPIPKPESKGTSIGFYLAIIRLIKCGILCHSKSVPPFCVQHFESAILNFKTATSKKPLSTFSG